MAWIILLIVGFVGGTVGSIAGLGGGIVIVPSLLFLETSLGVISNMGPQIIVGTSYLVLIATGLSSTIAYMKQKKVDFNSGFIFFIGSGPGAIVGALINRFFETDQFAGVFGLLMIGISLLMFFTKSIKPIGIIKTGKLHTYTDENGMSWEYKYSTILAIIICFFIGILSGLFGIGGGSLLVPIMLLLFGFPTAVAIPTSMFIVFLSGITGSVTHVSLGNVHWLYALALIPGAWFGARFGAYLNRKLNEKVVVTIFRLILIIIGFRMVINAIIG
ncbi:sulfite exporter TauE/SafE family protein [Aquibacillus sediminis]|uniref:sulfite exporter TauE/SafE family protein n=1 Tax=Aquibacillus sediminis TaxID=2574734 RepID=UPI001109A888|nr:sulfite exporter TauE/SafE family protein [Aquibacillus sediminis]